MSKFAQVILPLPLYSSFTYSVPEELEEEIEVGSRVLVQFGSKNYYSGIVESVHTVSPIGYAVKPILSVLDNYPLVRYPQLKFWYWISEYYLCSIGEVYKAAVPSGLKIESETIVTLNPDYEYDESDRLTERMSLIIQILDINKRMKLIDIERELGIKHINKLINDMLDLEIIQVDERIVDKYRAKKETIVRLNCERGDQTRLHELFNLVGRSQKQERMLIAYLDMSEWLHSERDLEDVEKRVLIEKSMASTSVFNALVEKGIFSIYKKEINRFKLSKSNIVALPNLTSEQLRAYNEIVDNWKTKDVALLRGVTGSGKTEIYSHLIKAVLEQGNQVLYLVPEISLTTQLTTRLQRIFGERLIIYHSKFTDNERVDIWKKLLRTTEPLIILGVRSSVFLPFSRLGMVIVDEEHEPSYKQYDPAPRYNARDAAIVLASMHGAKTLLGSATPSIESYYKAKIERYGMVELLERFQGINMPDVEVVDMREMRKKKENNGIFSTPMLMSVRNALDNGKQSIMFQNRRGFAPIVVCKECGWTPKCVNCDVSLVYHKRTNEIRCHYCGHTLSLPPLCPACGQNGVEIYGYGTERIAESLQEIFPETKVARMDLDTTRNKDSYEEIIDAFSHHQTDILVGTQMVSKGLDFENVAIVGVLNADTMLNFPDFRSNERAFNMLEQVAGRAGRKHERGKVIIQTTDPENPIIKYVKAHDYLGYYKEELTERSRFCFPPFTKVINIYLKHKDEAIVDRIAVDYTIALQKVFGERVLGPEKPFVSRVATYYLQCIMLKIEAKASMRKVKALLRQIYEKMSEDRQMKNVVLYYDVDPV